MGKQLGMLLLVLACGSLVFAQHDQGQKPANGRGPGITALALTPDEKGCLVGSQRGVEYRPLQGDHQMPLPTKLEHVHALAFAPDGKRVAVAGGTPAVAGVVELWDWPQRQPAGELADHTDVVYDVVWLDQGKRLATCSADRNVKIWDAGSGKCVHTLTGHSAPILALAVSPDGNLLCSGSADSTIRVWQAKSGKLLRALVNHLGPVHSLAFRPGQPPEQPAYLASAGGDSTVRIWQPAIGRMVRIVRHPAPVFAVTWGRDGKFVMSGGKDGGLYAIDGDSDQFFGGRLITSGGWVLSLARCERSDQVVVGDSEGKMTLAPTRFKTPNP
jgi:WD40 repeat protein